MFLLFASLFTSEKPAELNEKQKIYLMFIICYVTIYKLLVRFFWRSTSTFPNIKIFSLGSYIKRPSEGCAKMLRAAGLKYKHITP